MSIGNTDDTARQVQPPLKLEFIIRPPKTIIGPGSPLPKQVVIRFTSSSVWTPGPQEFLLFRAQFIPIQPPSSVALSPSNDMTSILISVCRDDVLAGRDLVSFRTYAPAMPGIYRLQVSGFVCQPDYVGLNELKMSLSGCTVSPHIHVRTEQPEYYPIRHLFNWLTVHIKRRASY
jgi:hypothetical protein